MQLQNKIKLDDLEYTTKKKSVIISVDTLYLLFFFKRYTWGKFLIIKYWRRTNSISEWIKGYG